MIEGFICGVVSSVGFAILSPKLKEKGLLHDTCGVLNLHGMPGIIGAITSAILAHRADDNFGPNYMGTQGNYFRIVRGAPAQAGY
jgi:ammonia channel protein AmtB